MSVSALSGEGGDLIINIGLTVHPEKSRNTASNSAAKIDETKKIRFWRMQNAGTSFYSEVKSLIVFCRFLLWSIVQMSSTASSSRLPIAVAVKEVNCYR